MQAALAPLTLSTAALVLANLVPLGGVLLGIWSVSEIMLLFWAENVVIGVLQVARMGAVLVLRREVALIVLIAFFAVHYGIFTFVHGMFVVTLFAPPEIEGMADAIAFLLSATGLLWPLLALVASHGLSFALNFLGGGEWRRIEAGTLMMQPYGRVVVLHLVILAGGAITLALGEPLGALVVLVVLKIGVDVVAHRRQHAAAPA